MWKMFYKEILEQTGPGSAFLEHLEVQIFWLSAKPGGTLVDSMDVPVCPKKLWIRHCRRKLTRIRKILFETNEEVEL